tara:strand:- start:1065 stop:2336 length:1272 start_codon:yes stop_codon:yes gene_type:complete
MLDIQLLRIVKYRSKFFQIYKRIPQSALDTVTRSILEDFEVYFSKMPEAKAIDIPTLLPIFRARRQHFSADQIAAYEAVLPKIQQDVSEEQASGIMVQMLELRMAAEVAGVVEKFNEGDIANLHAEIAAIEIGFAADAEIKGVAYLTNHIGDLLLEETDENGVKFRLACLQEAFRGMRGGDFGILAGRPDRGKTTFLSSECTYWASQLAPERNIVWLNNEGPGKRIIPRLYQSALGLTMTEMKEMHAKGKLVDAYKKAIGGRIDKIRIVDIHGLDTYAVENIIRDNNAGIIIYDMIDHIKGFGGEARTDLMLEEMYKWAREVSVKYDCVGIGTSQISNEGDGMQFPTLGMLKDSKTGKQGACDFQIMIGASNDPNLQGLRYIGAPKNKLRREGAAGDPRATVAFKPMIARFEDVPVDPIGEEE